MRLEAVVMSGFGSSVKSAVRRALLPRLHRIPGHDPMPVIPQAVLTRALPTDFMFTLLEASRIAAGVDLAEYAERLPFPEDVIFFNQWPGEHYRLLFGLTKVLKPALTVEIGTYRGASALAMADHSDRVVTYDIISLGQMPGAVTGQLEDKPNVEQRIGDLAEEEYFDTQSELFRDADLVVIDGPKDGRFEYIVIPKVLATMKPGAILVLDDVRFRNMQDLWATLPRPRIDFGSLGHWSGTGIVLA